MLMKTICYELISWIALDKHVAKVNEPKFIQIIQATAIVPRTSRYYLIVRLGIKEPLMHSN